MASMQKERFSNVFTSVNLSSTLIMLTALLRHLDIIFDPAFPELHGKPLMVWEGGITTMNIKWLIDLCNKK